jgi:hypothetical protein
MVPIEDLEAAQNEISNADSDHWAFQDHFSLQCGILLEILRTLQMLSEKIEGQTAMISAFIIKQPTPQEPDEKALIESIVHRPEEKKPERDPQEVKALSAVAPSQKSLSAFDETGSESI